MKRLFILPYFLFFCYVTTLQVPGQGGYFHTLVAFWNVVVSLSLSPRIGI